MLAGVPLLRVRGVPIVAHWSVLFVGVFVPPTFASLLRAYHPGLSGKETTVMALVSVLLYFISLVLHELGHALQARREGYRAEQILLWGLGGVAYHSGVPRSAGADYRVVAAGPLVTLALAVLFAALSLLSEGAGLGEPVRAVLTLQAAMNAVLLAFNLLPVFPLDGGQLLYAALRRVRGYASAAVWTVRAGMAVALGVLAIGVVGPFVGVIPAPLSGAFFDGSRFMVSGVLLLLATTAIRPPSRVVQVALRARQVSDLLQPEPVVLSPDTTTAEFIRALPRARGYSAGVYPVVDDGRVLGIVSPGLAVDAVERGSGEEPVTATMVRKEDAVVLRPSMSIEEGFAALDGAQSAGVVLHDGRVLGILRRSDLAAAMLEAREARHGSVVPAAPSPVRVSW